MYLNIASQNDFQTRKRQKIQNVFKGGLAAASKSKRTSAAIRVTFFKITQINCFSLNNLPRKEEKTRTFSRMAAIPTIHIKKYGKSSQ